MNSNRILLIAPSYRDIYDKTRFHKEGVLYSPSLTLAVLAGALRKNNQKVDILDINLIDNFDDALLIDKLKNSSYKYVGITFTTPLFSKMSEICKIVKNFDKKIVLVGGGPHASSLPEETLKETLLDIVIKGEGDLILPKIVSGENISSIPNIFYKQDSRIVKNPSTGPISDLDSLPLPAWDLFDIAKVKTSNLLSERNPVGSLETSRGCPFSCIYCNKSVFGKGFKAKNPVRVVDEIEYMLKIGFKEIHIIDDGFSTDIERAKEICRLIIKRKLIFYWSPIGGLRVDRAPRELLELMYAAGCYRIYYGIESGNQKILENIEKGITLKQVRQAVKDAKDVGLEVVGFFIIGLPGEQEGNLKETIKFAKELDLDMAKATIATPLPGTPLFDSLEEKGLIISKDWSALNLYTPSKKIFIHPTLKWETIEKYLSRFYRDFYLDPKFICKRFIYSFRKGKLFSDIKYLLRTKW